MAKVQEIVTGKVVEALNSGKVPWVKPWQERYPFNAQSGRAYTGINRFILDNTPFGYLTFNKIKELGGTLQKGSKGNLVTLWTFVENKKAEKINGKYPTFPMLRYYNVFSVEDVTGLPEKFYNKTERTFRTLDQFAEIAERHIITINHGGNSAHYSPGSDCITMPNKAQFASERDYHQVLAHELIHWTAKRLGRELSQKKELYAFEELIAEMGAAMLLGEFGLDYNIENTAAYCKGWGEKIAADQWLVCKAASRAEKAVEFLLNGTEFVDEV